MSSVPCFKWSIEPNQNWLLHSLIMPLPFSTNFGTQTLHSLHKRAGSVESTTGDKVKFGHGIK